MTLTPNADASPKIVVLSGPVGAGKSTLARGLADQYRASYIRTQDLMREHAESRGNSLPNERRALQNYGDQLDLETDGRWVADAVSETIANDDGASSLVIVDAIRLKSQVDHLRKTFPGRVTHIHVHAPRAVLSSRYSERSSDLKELPNYEAVAENATEAAVSHLEADADVAIDTNRCTKMDVQTRAAAALRLLPSRSLRLVDVLVGGQYGSEGKGNIAYYLVRQPPFAS